jgi:spermidine synthase
MGFTLRAALGRLATDAEVAVVELMPAVVRWNRTPDYALGADALADPRVAVIEGDVVDVLRDSPGRFDAVILDVDNGASGLSVASNDRLYSLRGLQRAAAALRPGGCLAVWSADDDPAFADRLGRTGFAVTIERARVHAAGGGWTTLFLGRLARPR